MSAPPHTRSFRLLFTGRALSLLGDAVIPVALGLAVLEATGSTTALALVLGCAILPKLLLLPVGGVVGDRFNPRTVALTTDLVRCATQLFVGTQLLTGSPALWQIAVASAVGGAAGAFAMPALAPLITGTVGAGELRAANSWLGIAESSTRLGGPALGGVLVVTAGAGWAFLLDGLSFAVSAALLVGVRVARPAGPRHTAPRRSLLADLTEGWQEVRVRDWYWTSLIAHSVWNGAAAVLLTLGPAVALKDMGGEGSWVAMLQTGAVGLLLGSLLAGRARPRRPVLAANLGLASYALPLALLAVSAPAPATIAAYGIAQAGLGYLGPVWETAVQQAVPPHALARVTSYDWLLSLAAMPLGYTLAPLAASAWGPRVPLAFAAVAVGTACLGTALAPGVRRFGPAETPPTELRTPDLEHVQKQR